MPEPSTQFWMNWGVQFAVALATLLAVSVALFGQAFRAKFFPPKLSLTVADPDGERYEDARYYRLSISNARRWSPANQVQVILTSVEEPTADGKFAASWVGDIPLTWKHQSAFPAFRTIGPTSEIDLCSLVKGKGVLLHPLITPTNFPVTHSVASNLILSVQAKSNEQDSAILRLHVSWDGKWEDGTQEMRRHFVLKVIDDEASV